MIEGEIRVGDRLIHWRSDRGSYVAFIVASCDAGEVQIVNRDGHDYRPEEHIREAFDRDRNFEANPGWTRITPETLPGDDVEEAIMWSYVLGYVHVGRDAHVCRWGSDRFRDGILTHWRPVPPEFFPVPKP